MADTRYLKRRRQGWYFQLAVPARLIKVVGKATITASLKTRDLTVAQERRWAMLVNAQEDFAKLEGRRVEPAAEPLDPEALLEIDDLARAAYRETLARLDAEARKGICSWGAADLDRAWGEACHGYLNEQDFKPVAEPLAAYCAKHEVEPGSPHYAVAGDALLSARMHALKGRKLALQGKPSDEPSTFLDRPPIDPVSLKPLRAGPRRGGLIFAEVAARFIAERQRDPAFALTEQTKGQYEAALRLFDRWARQPRLDDVDRRKASDFLDAIASLSPNWGRGPGTKSPKLRRDRRSFRRPHAGAVSKDDQSLCDGSEFGMAVRRGPRRLRGQEPLAGADASHRQTPRQ